MEGEKRKYILFGVQGRKFAIDIERVKKVEKDKGNSLGIVHVEGSKDHVIGVGEIEIAQNDKRLIPFIDFKKIIDVEGLENSGGGNRGKQINVEGKYAESGSTADDQELEEGIMRKRRVFLIVSLKDDYVGILIDELLEIFEIEENKNAEVYPPPRGAPDIFDKVIVVIGGSEGKGVMKLDWREKIFSINVDKFEKYI